MSKEYLEALKIYLDKRIKDIKNYLEFNERSEDEKGFPPSEELQICYLAKRMLAIDNAVPSEALEKLKTIKIKCHPNSNPSPLVDEALEVVEQTLLKSQEQEKTLKVIFKKNVNMSNLAAAIGNNSLRLYNGSIPGKFKYLRLTKEEFDLLKRNWNDLLWRYRNE